MGDLNFWIGVATLAAIWGIFTLGIQLNAGITGLLNFGQAGFMALGAYTMGILVVQYEWSLWIAMAASLILISALSAVLGLITGQLRKDYFAIASLAIAQLIVSVAQNARSTTGGSQGLFGFDGDWFNLANSFTDAIGPVGGELRPQIPLLVVSVALLIIAAAALGAAKRTGWGRVLRAIREDEDAAASLGKNVRSYKLQSLVISGILAGIAGWLLALNLGLLAPSQFDSSYTFLGYAALILGGLGTIRGALFGTALLWFLMEGSRLIDLPLDADQVAALRFLIVGLLLMLLVGFRPQGLFGQREELHLER